MKRVIPSCRAGFRSVSAGAMLLVASLLYGSMAHAETDPPIGLALFEFELEDFSAFGGGSAASAADAAYLERVTGEARRLIEASGRYDIVDTAGAGEPAAREHWLRKCDGCEAAIASKLGAEQSFVGVVTRISRTEYWVRYQIRDAKTGRIVSSERTDLRMGADYSWSRGAARLIQARLLDLPDRP